MSLGQSYATSTRSASAAMQPTTSRLHVPHMSTVGIAEPTEIGSISHLSTRRENVCWLSRLRLWRP